jgi:molybdenum cofactor cytidylyltransferase
MNSPILILAAGASTRMGQPKQMLVVDGQPLLVHSVREALATGVDVFVVIGANAETHKTMLSGLPIHLVEHPQWLNGMGSSLKAGLKEILVAYPDATGVLVMLCDQPKVSRAHLEILQHRATRSEKEIVASHYNQTFGVPALFKQPLFSSLLALGDEAGAAKLIRSHPDKVEVVDFPEGSIDLDTPEDLARYTGSPGLQ